ncbi:MAG TPA: hypothetical protein VE987_01470, partial [Polyangiaceae bacterium]|nr:hypothetical protein [Polyangiaceae bacterium]
MIAAQPASAGDVGAVEAPLVAVELRRDGVAVVRLDDGRKISGPPSPSFGAELAAVVDRIEGDPSIAGAVLTGCRREPGDAGVDVDLLRSIKFASDAERLARDAAQALGRVAGAKKPFVAAVQGP